MPDQQRRCMSTNTVDGKPCQYLEHSCPIDAHRLPNRSGPTSAPSLPGDTEVDLEAMAHPVGTTNMSSELSLGTVAGFLDTGTEIGLPPTRKSSTRPSATCGNSILG